MLPQAPGQVGTQDQLSYVYLGYNVGDIGCTVAHLGAKLPSVASFNVGPDGLDPGPVDTIEPPI